MIKDLEEAVKSLPQIDCPVVHHFSDDIYARELFIPAGVCLIGAKHKTNHFIVINQGECYISLNGAKAKKFKAPFIAETKAGTQRAITAITDTIIITFHVTDEQDPIKIGEAIIVNENHLPQWKRKALEVVK